MIITLLYAHQALQNISYVLSPYPKSINMQGSHIIFNQLKILTLFICKLC